VADHKAPQPRLSLAKRRKARQLILQALYQWQLAGADPLEIVSQFHEQNPGKKIDWAYFDEVFVEIPKQVVQLDEVIQPLLDRASSALDPIEKSLLHLGAYELINRLDIPYRVVINEAVELAKVFGATDGHKYINGVLDKLAARLRPDEFAKRKQANRK